MTSVHVPSTLPRSILMKPPIVPVPAFDAKLLVNGGAARAVMLAGSEQFVNVVAV